MLSLARISCCSRVLARFTEKGEMRENGEEREDQRGRGQESAKWIEYHSIETIETTFHLGSKPHGV